MIPVAAQSGEWTAKIGEILGGKYQVTRLIGRGGMGVVVEARHLDLGERVAVKVLHPRYIDNAEAVTRFHHEARAAAQIRGEHSVRLIDFGTLEESGSPYLVMELLEGRDLTGVIDAGPVTLADAALYILQACEGMAEVHAHGIVHRDLKPGNLFLTKSVAGEPLIKVLDFGIAKGVAVHDPQVGSLTQTLVSLGTPLYMSPEQVRSSRQVDARADVWSLGVIFYELVAGRPAFGGNTVTHITAQVLEGTPFALTSLRPDLPPAIDAVIDKVLTKNPEGRYVDVAALAAALEPFAGPRGVGYAERAARILRGVLRPDAALIFAAEDSKPALRDDELGGTRRYDRSRRVLLARVALGALALLAVTLVVAAITAYRGSVVAAEHATARLDRAFRLTSGYARLAMEKAAAHEARPAAAGDGGAVASASKGAPSPSSAVPSGTPAPAAGALRGAGPTQAAPTSQASSAATRPPPVATEPPAAQKTASPSAPFNPYADRN